MAVSTVSTNTTQAAPQNGEINYKPAFIVLTSLFFMWGLITSLNDIIIPHLKAVFNLNYTEAMLVQFTFFTTYAVVSLPSGILVEKIGYKKGIITGLMIAGLGCVLFYPAADFRLYGVFLFALFVLAAGITLLQVAANPYVAMLGKPETASARMNLSQGFNSIGTVIGPILGSILILSVGVKSASEIAAMMPAEAEAYRLAEASSVQFPYLLLAGMLVVIAVVFALFKLPKFEAATASGTDISDTSGKSNKSAWSHRHLVLGAIGIFVYVGAEVSIGSFLVNYFNDLLSMPDTEAGTYVSLYWGGLMVGRFLGSITLSEMNYSKNKKYYVTLIFLLGLILSLYVTGEYQNFADFSIEGFSKTIVFLLLVLLNYAAFSFGKTKPGRTITILAICAAVLVVISMFTEGYFAMYAIIAVGLFNSIMFPTIFALAIDGLGKHTGQASGILCTAIVGGAIVPVLQGVFADNIGIQHAFFLPVLCYIYIAYYGAKGHIPVNK